MDEKSIMNAEMAAKRRKMLTNSGVLRSIVGLHIAFCLSFLDPEANRLLEAKGQWLFMFF